MIIGYKLFCGGLNEREWAGLNPIFKGLLYYEAEC